MKQYYILIKLLFKGFKCNFMNPAEAIYENMWIYMSEKPHDKFLFCVTLSLSYCHMFPDLIQPNKKKKHTQKKSAPQNHQEPRSKYVQ